MKEHPILFSTPMVQAILEGRKTQTRRICKHQHWSHSELTDVNVNGISQKVDRSVTCPYGQPGDLLWVRETFCFPSLFDGFEDDYYYKANFNPGNFETRHASQGWKPSIHMPKAAARVWLEITEVKVERLQDISEEDAIAEGCFKYGPFGEYAGSKHPSGGAMTYRAYSKAARAFQCIWESINGEQSWKKKPWVWVIKFEVLSTEGNPENLKIYPENPNLIP